MNGGKHVNTRAVDQLSVVHGASDIEISGSGQPRYLEIAAALRQSIHSGELAPGASLPSEREVAKQWRVARPTAARALHVLRQEGLTQVRPGAGTFVRVIGTGSPNWVGGDDAVRQHVVVSQGVPHEVSVLIGLPPAQLLGRHSLVRAAANVYATSVWFRQSDCLGNPALASKEACDELEIIQAHHGRARVLEDQVWIRLASGQEQRVLRSAQMEPEEPLSVLVRRRTFRLRSSVLAVQDTICAQGHAPFTWETHLG